MTNTNTSFRIEVFRSGTFKPMTGEAITYAADDLAGIVEAYDPEAAPAPVVIGHPTTDAPAYGWVSGFEYDADADLLYADIGDLEPAFAEAVRAGRYKKVSMSFHTPGAANNPTPGKWHAKHVGFLGGAAPAVSGLKPVQFSEAKEGEAVTFEACFGEYGFEEAASLFRGVRDWIIAQFGLEKADEVLPSYRIDWLGDIEIASKPQPTPLFVAPPKEEITMTMTPEQIAQQAELDARAAAQTAREAEFAVAETNRRNEAHVAFADTLVADGRLLAASRDAVISVLGALPAGQDVSFADGDAQPLGEALMDILEAQPKVIEFGASDLGDDPGAITGDAKQIAAFATKYQNEQAAAGITISISEAVEHVSKGASA